MKKTNSPGTAPSSISPFSPDYAKILDPYAKKVRGAGKIERVSLQPRRFHIYAKALGA